MTRRLTLAIAIMAVAALAFLPGVASAQNATGSPPAVAGVVIEAPTTAPAVSGNNLARTGSSNVIPMTAGAVALLVVGGVLVVGTRRRRGDNGSVRLA